MTFSKTFFAENGKLGGSAKGARKRRPKSHYRKMALAAAAAKRAKKLAAEKKS